MSKATSTLEQINQQLGLVREASKRTWLQITVELLEGHGDPVKPAPGRIFVVAPTHTFAQLASAIDTAFGRWDLAHLHSFTLKDKREIGIPNDDEPDILDDRDLLLAEAVGPGDRFEYVFDYGDNWRHRCTVSTDLVDPLSATGGFPGHPVPIFGWGTLPDQYLRKTDDD